MPSKNIANNPVLVTGASGALGSAMIDVILERGAPVVAVGHDREALAGLPERPHREVAHETPVDDYRLMVNLNLPGAR